MTLLKTLRLFVSIFMYRKEEALGFCLYRLKDESRTPNENEKRRHIPPTKKKKKKKKTERTPRARRGKAHSFYCKVVGVVVFY